MRFEPAVFSTGFHRRKLKALTGLDVQDRQAQRLLGEMEAYRAVRYGGRLPLADVLRTLTRASSVRRAARVNP